MTSAYDIARRCMLEALAEAAANNIPNDVLARAFLEGVLDIYRQTRGLADIASELQFHADNLDPDGDQIFIRP